jgi:hypothetical protein
MIRNSNDGRILTAVVAMGIIFGTAFIPFTCDQGEYTIRNPYEAVEWETYGHYKAALHLHTTQSDGFHHVDEVIRAYRDAGFSIISITDHDSFYPNWQLERERTVPAGTTPYLFPAIENFPAHTTWPWTAYGSLSPEAHGIVGIEGNELTTLHHMNSYFNDYGTTGGVSEDEQLYAVRDKGGVAIFNHPGHTGNWWTKRSTDWYIERFEKHSDDYLLGIEITTGGYYDYNVALWDQLLAHFMPERPIWGFGSDDMHRLESVPFAYTVFLLDTLDESSVREAFLKGQFYFVRSSHRVNYMEYDPEITWNIPSIHDIAIDASKGIVSITASNYDEIHWISLQADTLRGDYDRGNNERTPFGRIIGRGDSIELPLNDILGPYIRAEIINTAEDEEYRLFLNPFSISKSAPQ